MLPIAEVIHNYYDKQRRLNYIRVTRMLSKADGEGPVEPLPNLESDTESSNQQDEEESRSLITHQETVLPQSLINSLYLRPTALPLSHKKTLKADSNSSRSITGLYGILAGIFKDPIMDTSSFSVSVSHRLDTEKGQLDSLSNLAPGNPPIVLRDCVLLKKKKCPSLIKVHNLRLTHDKNQWEPQGKAKVEPQVDKDLDNIKQTTMLKKKPAERVGATTIVQKALQRQDSRLAKDQQTKEKRTAADLEESGSQLKKSFQNLNIHININFNERKKEQTSDQKEQLKDSKEEVKKDYPKLNLFSLITKTKKQSIADGVATTQETKVNACHEKTLSSLDFVKVFKKKASEPEPSSKALKQTFMKKNSKPGANLENPKSAANQAEELKLLGRDLMFVPKKHSVTSSINSIQQAIIAGKNRMANYRSAERTESATKKNIDIFDKKRKVSMLSNNNGLTKSKKDLRSSMKCHKLTSCRHNSSSTKIEPKSSRQGKASRSAKKNTKKLFMSQDFNQSPQMLAATPFEAKPQGFNVSAQIQNTLKGNGLNQPNLLSNSQNKRFALFGPKYSSTKESSNDPFGNLTYRSKKSSSKYAGLHGGGSEVDLAGKRKKQDRNYMKFSEANIHQAEPVMAMSKKKRVADVTGAMKHSRVKSDMKVPSKAH